MTKEIKKRYTAPERGIRNWKTYRNTWRRQKTAARKRK